jgi:hypothetical protein
MTLKKAEVLQLLSSWKTVADFVYTDDANEEALRTLLDAERASFEPRASVMALLYQRFSTKRRERELEEIFGAVKDGA